MCSTLQLCDTDLFKASMVKWIGGLTVESDVMGSNPVKSEKLQLC